MINPKEFFEELHLSQDSKIADFGCGDGRNSILISEYVPSGNVYAIDIHKEKLEYLDEKLKKENITNIKTVWGDIEELEGTRIRDDSIDLVLLTDTFSYLPHKRVCLMEAKRILKKRGKILFVDYHRHLGESAHHKALALDIEALMSMFEEAGFGVYPVLKNASYQFALLAEKK